MLFNDCSVSQGEIPSYCIPIIISTDCIVLSLCFDYFPEYRTPAGISYFLRKKWVKIHVTFLCTFHCISGPLGDIGGIAGLSVGI